MVIASLRGARRRTADPSSPPSVQHRGLILAILGGCSAMIAVDSSAINLALDDMQAQFAMSVGALAWVINAYNLAWAAIMPIAGRVGDLRGRRGAFIGGAALFTAASMASGLAPNGEVVIAARAFQGVGAAFMFPATLAIAAALFPGRQRAKAIATLVTVAGIGQAGGPLIGGVLVQTIGWRALFFINVPLGVFAVVGALRMIPESRSPTPDQRIDWSGAALLTVGLISVVVGIDQAAAWGWASAATVAAIGGGIVLVVVFVVVEYRVERPLIGPVLLANQNLQALNLAGVTMFAVFIPTLMYSTLLTQNVFGYSAVEAGAALLPFVLPIALIARPAAALAERWDASRVMSLGYLSMVVGLASFATLLDPEMSIVAVLAPLVVAGCGFGTCIALIASTAVGSVAPDDAGTASGLNFAARLLGGAVGLSVATNLFEAEGGGTDVSAQEFVDALRLPLFVLAGAAAFGFIVNTAFVRDDRRLSG